MEKVDWNNPPKKLRITKDLKTATIDVFDESNKVQRNIEIKPSLLEAFTSGSDLVHIMPNDYNDNRGPIVRYKKQQDISQYVAKGAIRHTTYEMTEYFPPY
ncbi:hypothetical protein KAT24_01360 [Candidatus Pacearchaeota archaeon]|nr:hypothetical protein [Candidatus Pacearchaeota archaeon]